MNITASAKLAAVITDTTASLPSGSYELINFTQPSRHHVEGVTAVAPWSMTLQLRSQRFRHAPASAYGSASASICRNISAGTTVRGGRVEGGEGARRRGFGISSEARSSGRRRGRGRALSLRGRSTTFVGGTPSIRHSARNGAPPQRRARGSSNRSHRETPPMLSRRGLLLALSRPASRRRAGAGLRRRTADSRGRDRLATTSPPAISAAGASSISATHCPDVARSAAERPWPGRSKTLGPFSAAITPVFVTVDPDRDTPAVMKDYVAFFHPRLIGVTPSPRTTGDHGQGLAHQIRQGRRRREPGLSDGPHRRRHPRRPAGPPDLPAHDIGGARLADQFAAC